MAEKSILKNKPQALIKRFKEDLIKKGIPVDQMILFGSYAKGQPKPWSDLDVCVVSKSFGKDSYDEMVRLMIIASDIEPRLEPHPYHPNDLKDKYDPLAHEIRTHGQVIG